MSVPAEQTPAQPQLGDYRLIDVLSEGARTRTYHAQQISVDRDVILERIKAGIEADGEIVEHFLADVRAKAAVDHPVIGSVYEAVHEHEVVFYTRELLQGDPLEDLHHAGVSLAPARIAVLLRQLAGAMAYFRERAIATLSLEPRHLVLGPHDVLRISNLAVAAKHDPRVDGHDRHLVAELLLDLMQGGTVGVARMRDLLEKMGAGDGTDLTWSEIHRAAAKLEQDLSEGAKAASQLLVSDHSERRARSRSRRVIAVLIGFLVVAALGAGGFLLSQRKTVPKARDLSAMVEIPGGRYDTHDGKRVELKRFWIDAHEVSIGEYAVFLDALAALPAAKRTGYDHADQPAIKFDHIPDEWESMVTAARTGGSSEGAPFDLNYPITRIDWWDARAYAAWKGGRLPTQEEWLAASQAGFIEAGGRGAVDDLPGDVTSAGVHGMAGNVSEWILDPVTNPAFPMNPKSPVCCGASFLDPRNGARARLWPATREVRLPEVGFRIVRERAP